jgi:hypothetical protein
MSIWNMFFFDKMREAGYDGFHTGIPDEANQKKLLFEYLQKQKMYLITHQH